MRWVLFHSAFLEQVDTVFIYIYTEVLHIHSHTYIYSHNIYIYTVYIYIHTYYVHIHWNILLNSRRVSIWTYCSSQYLSYFKTRQVALAMLQNGHVWGVGVPAIGRYWSILRSSLGNTTWEFQHGSWFIKKPLEIHGTSQPMISLEAWAEFRGRILSQWLRPRIEKSDQFPSHSHIFP